VHALVRVPLLPVLFLAQPAPVQLLLLRLQDHSFPAAKLKPLQVALNKLPVVLLNKVALPLT
jgi:hypothetical protein